MSKHGHPLIGWSLVLLAALAAASAAAATREAVLVRRTGWVEAGPALPPEARAFFGGPEYGGTAGTPVAIDVKLDAAGGTAPTSETEILMPAEVAVTGLRTEGTACAQVLERRRTGSGYRVRCSLAATGNADQLQRLFTLEVSGPRMATAVLRIGGAGGDIAALRIR